MRRAQAGVLVLVALSLAAPASAQFTRTGSFDESRNRSFLDPDELNREACDDADGNATLTLRGSTTALNARFVGYVIEGLSGTGERPQCLSYVAVQTEPTATLAFDDELTSTASNFSEEIAVPIDELVGDACTVPGGRRAGDRALCVYMVDGVNALDSIGFFLAVDTDVPAKPEIEDLRPGNRRALFTVGNVEDDTADVYEFLVQYRRCGEREGDGGPEGGGTGGVDAGSEGADDAGPLGDGGDALDSGTLDSGTLDSGTLDSGTADSGTGTDAGATPDDGGDGDQTTQVRGDSVCGATADFTETEEDERSPDVAITGLENGVRYEVRVIVRDDFGNESEPSEPRTVTPAAGNGPLDLYNGAGSPYSTAPSCASTSGGASLAGLFALVGLLALPRRRRRGSRSRHAWLGLALLPALVGAAPGLAQADFTPESATTAARNGEVTFSLFGGPYKPAIDTERVGGETIFPIYDCFFGGATLIELGASVDYHLLDVFGSLQLGIAANATQAKGLTLSADAAASGTCGAKTTDSVELTVVKLKPQLTYRLDPLLDWFGFPLVPYGRLGVVGAFYAFTENGLFPTAETEAQNPLGLVLGWEAAAGLMLALDFWDYLDPFSKWGTLRGRANDVFNHAFLYGEAVWQPVDNFGAPSLILSPTDPFTGSSAPWTVQFGVAVELL